jgi:hypothetical protein
MTPFDKFFKTKLKHYGTDVPDYMWDNLQSQLPVRQRFGSGSFAIIALLIIFVLSALLTFDIYLHESEVDISKQAEVIASVEHETDNKSIYAVSGIGTTAELGNMSDDITKSKLFAIADNTLLPGSIAGEEKIQLFQGADTGNKNLTGLLAKERIFAVENPVKKTTSFISITETFSSSDIRDSEMAQSGKIAIETINEISFTSLRSDHGSGSLLPGVKFNPIQVNCPSFSYRPRGIFADIYFSGDQIQKHLQAKSSEGDKYRMDRMQSEKPLLSFAAGFRVGYNTGHNIALMTGLEYKQMNEKFEYIDPESNQTRLVTIKDYIYQNGNIVDSVITQEVIVIPGTVKYTVYNSFKSVNIPLIVEYNLLRGSKFNVAVAGGPVLNLVSYQKGTILSPNKDDNTISLSEPNHENSKVFRQSTGISLSGSINIQYRIKRDVAIMIAPNIRTQLNSITFDDYPLHQRFTTFGIAAGARYIF